MKPHYTNTNNPVDFPKMNERIEELAEQAFDKANNGTITDIKIPKEFIEKFAELIVQECISINRKRMFSD